MNTSVNLFAAICIAGICTISCTKEDNNTTELAQEAVENNLEAASWHITLFEDSGNDETAHFSGYDFTFEADGTLMADNGTNTVQGSWSISDSNSNDDSPDDLDLNLFFNVSNDFEELNEDWDIIAYTDMKIELIHISGGNGGTDYLTFERN